DSAPFDPDRTAAAALQALRLSRGRLCSLDTAVAPRTEANGVAAQHALARRMGADPPAGFKIGATARRMQEYLGLTGPAAGFIAPGGIHASGAALRFADFTRLGVECELAVRLARDLPPRDCTADEAAASVGELMAGIELVENRYGDLSALGTPALIADQVFHAAAVLGSPAADWRQLDLPRLAGRITVNGETRGEGVGADLLGHPMNCLAWLAGSPVAAAFGGLRAGQVVMLGSVTPPIWLDAPASVVVEFPSLPAVELRLD
ncbi:MAG: fumarylacetoacetate hydrolase family protein, partial [Pseudomonadota bacterium]|nr:fumarylacetoacetate hydrolase family protein [Pseudomonadota bacterium]